MEIFDRRSFKGSYFSVIPVAELSFIDIREHAVSCNEDSIFRPSTIVDPVGLVWRLLA